MLDKTYSINDSGNTVPDLDGIEFAYSIGVPSNTTFQGKGFSTVLKMASGSLARGIVNPDFASGNSGIILRDFMIDGSIAGADPSDRNHGIHLHKVTRSFLDNIFVYKSPTSCFRLESCSFIQIGKLQGYTDATGRDGINLIDCHDINADSFVFETYDDCVSISAWTADCYNISLSQINSKSTTARGILLTLADVARFAGNQRSIYNIQVRGVTHDCLGAGTHLAYARFIGLDLRLTDFESKSAFAAWIGSDDVNGYIKESKFDFTGYNNDWEGVLIKWSDKGETALGNSLTANIQSPNGDDNDYCGINIGYGSRWNLDCVIDYNPGDTLLNPNAGLAFSGSNSRIQAIINKGTYNIYMGTTADNNVITGCNLTNASNGTSIALGAGADNNLITGNFIDGKILDSAIGSRIYGNEGADETTTSNIPLSHWQHTTLNPSGAAFPCTLGDGKYVGQIKTISRIGGGTNQANVNILHHETSDPEVARFDADDEYIMLLWTGTEWITVVNSCTFP